MNQPDHAFQRIQQVIDHLADIGHARAQHTLATALVEIQAWKHSLEPAPMAEGVAIGPVSIGSDVCGDWPQEDE
jgi:hypothetical protein